MDQRVTIIRRGLQIVQRQHIFKFNLLENRKKLNNYFHNGSNDP